MNFRKRSDYAEQTTLPGKKQILTVGRFSGIKDTLMAYKKIDFHFTRGSSHQRRHINEKRLTLVLQRSRTDVEWRRLHRWSTEINLWVVHIADKQEKNNDVNHRFLKYTSLRLVNWFTIVNQRNEKNKNLRSLWSYFGSYPLMQTASETDTASLLSMALTLRKWFPGDTVCCSW